MNQTDDKHGAPKGPTFLPCPFCGRNPDPTDPSTLHPTGTVWRDEAEFRSYHSHSERQEGDGRCWVFACLTESGGCGAEVHGDSEEEAIIAWNRRSAPSAIDSTELARLREIEHVAWHLLDDAEENAQTGDITLFRGSGDYEKLCALLPEDHPSAVTEIGTRHPDAYIEHHKGGNNLVWEETNLPCTPLYKSAPAEVDAPKPSTDYRDAERWRYARDHLFIGYIADDVAESWDDEAIDAAIRSHRGPSTPQEKK